MPSQVTSFLLRGSSRAGVNDPEQSYRSYEHREDNDEPMHDFLLFVLLAKPA
jgi:hypothetical protein